LTALAVVIVAYESASHLAGTLAALRPQLREGDELVIVDNASSDDPGSVAGDAEVLRLPENVGFAGGCNAGAAATSAPLLFFLNPDAAPAAGCLEALRAAAGAHRDWGAWQAVVALPGGEEVNTRGGDVHWLGVGWSGGYGSRVADAREDRPVGFASGAALVVRRDAWDAAGGFDADYFMYGEDLDLSLRLRLAGWEVGVAGEAVVEHDYEFAKGERKWFLLERNRWWTVLSDYPAGLLLALLPALLAAEAALLLVAARGGWLRAKLRAQAAVVRELPQILARRREVQARRVVGAALLAERLSASLDNPYLAREARIRTLGTLQGGYWAGVRAMFQLLGFRPDPPSKAG
jgi:N-acetylglucosaminyl-diphospho-decaprenol L-rhamnosyltransferase